jgi:nicotinamide-nucleotide amidase
MLLNEVARLLLQKKQTLAVAESCTGGLIAHDLTNISGSSKYFKLGLVLYGNDEKARLLRIKKPVIKRFGAVSGQIATLMAKRVRLLAKTKIGLSTTGFAGPNGGNKNNPVGTIYIAVACKNCAFSKRYKFSGTRKQIKNKAKNKALLLIKQCLQKQ